MLDSASECAQVWQTSKPVIGIAMEQLASNTRSTNVVPLIPHLNCISVQYLNHICHSCLGTEGRSRAVKILIKELYRLVACYCTETAFWTLRLPISPALESASDLASAGPPRTR